MQTALSIFVDALAYGMVLFIISIGLSVTMGLVRRMTTLLVEQQVERALDFAEHVLIMERGRVAWAGTAEQLRDDHGLIERYIGVGIH